MPLPACCAHREFMRSRPYRRLSSSAKERGVSRRLKKRGTPQIESGARRPFCAGFLRRLPIIQFTRVVIASASFELNYQFGQRSPINANNEFGPTIAPTKKHVRDGDRRAAAGSRGLSGQPNRDPEREQWRQCGNNSYSAVQMSLA